VDWPQTHNLYKGLHFPASDIPAQVRAHGPCASRQLTHSVLGSRAVLHKSVACYFYIRAVSLNSARALSRQGPSALRPCQKTARLVVRSRRDLDPPLVSASCMAGLFASFADRFRN